MGGMDYREMGWVEYQECLGAWNRRHNGEGDKPEPRPGGGERMKRAMVALAGQ